LFITNEEVGGNLQKVKPPHHHLQKQGI